MLPNFLIIGAQKSGTTSIYDVLKMHPQIFLSKVKEINFFFFEKSYKKGIQNYEQNFKDVNNEIAIGEASPGYIVNPNAPSRIKKHMPDCKLILCIRNPIERAYSQYWDNRRQLNEWQSFDEIVDSYIKIKGGKYKKGYFLRGFYHKQILEFLQYFNRQQILILLFDDLIANPEQFYQTVLSFLNINSKHFNLDVRKKSNQVKIFSNPCYKFFLQNYQYTRFLNRYTRRILRIGNQINFKKPQINQTTKEKLKQVYLEENRKLSDFLGRDLSNWNEIS